jgi:hypothetical protein
MTNRKRVPRSRQSHRRRRFHSNPISRKVDDSLSPQLWWTFPTTPVYRGAILLGVNLIQDDMDELAILPWKQEWRGVYADMAVVQI